MSTVFSGPRAELRRGDTLVAWCTDVSGSVDIQQTPIECLGEIDVSEFVTTARRFRMTAGFVRVIDNDLVTLLLTPAGGANVSEVINFPDLTMQLYDKVADRIAYQFEGVKLSGSGWQMQARSICTTNVTIVARTMKYGSELK